MRSAPDDITETLASLAIFADLTRPELEKVAHSLEERYFAQDERVLREGLTGSGFYIVLEGEAALVAHGKRLGTLGRGDFFGEISVLLGEPPVAVVGSGPGGLQISYSLSRLGLRHAVISADESAGGMFRKWPFFQRLLSWTKPYAP